MNDKPFFNTNVVLYAFRQDDTRGQVAETLLAAGGALYCSIRRCQAHPIGGRGGGTAIGVPAGESWMIYRAMTRAREALVLIEKFQ